MQVYNKREDLTKVFDKTWKANHNDDVIRAKEKEKRFIDRLFDVKSSVEKKSNYKPLTPSEQAGNLQKNIDGMNNFVKQGKINDIRGKFD